MALVTSNSELSQIRRTEELDAREAQKTDTAPKVPRADQGVNFFVDRYNDGFILNKVPQQTDFILEGFPRTNFLDKRGNVSLPYSDRDPFESSVNNNGAPLLKIHNKDDFLDKYYLRIKKDGDPLNIRKNDRFGFDQPFVIREVGNTLGLTTRVQPSKFVNPVVAKTINFAAELVNEIGGVVLGRNPNDFTGAALNSITRTSKFLVTSEGAGFLLKQDVLTKRNPQKERTDVRYGLTNNDLSKIQNIRKYDPLSLGSIPGVTKVSIYAPDPNLIVSPYLDTIAARISERATTLAGEVGNIIKGIASNIGQEVGQRLIGVANNIPGINSVISRVTTSVDNLRKEAADLTSSRKAISKIFEEDANSILGKDRFQKIDPQAAADVGVDKVNLIPYGSDGLLSTGESYEKLDFCPFKFYDVRNDASIVFRAILSGITDTFTPEYSSERYVGRPDSVYVYQGTEREISFTFDIYPKSDAELVTLWEKMNYLAGLTYPSWNGAGGGGMGMISPICELTIGDMYRDAPGYLSGLTYTIMDEGTWELDLARLPKYVQASATFVYIGKRLPSSTQKHYDVPWVGEEVYVNNNPTAAASVGPAQGQVRRTGELVQAIRDRNLNIDNLEKVANLKKIFDF